MPDGSQKEVEVGDIKVRSAEEARNYEAQGFMSPDELKRTEQEFSVSQPKTGVSGWLDKLREMLRPH